MKENNAAINYIAGAGTALSYMAAEGAPEEQVASVAALMDVDFHTLDEGDKARFITAYGNLPVEDKA